MVNKCTKCCEEKPATEFNKSKKNKTELQSWCKECKKEHKKNKKEYYSEYSKNYSLNNKEKINIYKKDYYKKNKIKLDEINKFYKINHKEQLKPSKKISAKKYQINHKEQIKEYKRKYEKNRRDKEPIYKLIFNLRVKTCDFLKGKNKSKHSKELIGYNSENELKKFIESKFVEGMSWDNYGKWHIDHIFPLSKIDKNNPEEIKMACHYTNLQPLWAEDNLKKHNMLPEEWEQHKQREK